MKFCRKFLVTLALFFAVSGILLILIKETKYSFVAGKVLASELFEIDHGDLDRKAVILTFDCDTDNKSTDKILEVLDKYHLKASFFINGKWASENSDTVIKIAQKGHDIYNHTFSHPYLTQLSDEEIREELTTTDDLIFELTGEHTKPYFRAPYGHRNEKVLIVAASIGYKSVYWTTDAGDWKEKDGITKDQVEGNILSNLKPGAIFLMHVSDSISGDVIEDVILKIQGQGYAIVPLSEGLE